MRHTIRIASGPLAYGTAASVHAGDLVHTFFVQSALVIGIAKLAASPPNIGKHGSNLCIATGDATAQLPVVSPRTNEPTVQQFRQILEQPTCAQAMKFRQRHWRSKSQRPRGKPSYASLPIFCSYSHIFSLTNSLYHTNRVY